MLAGAAVSCLSWQSAVAQTTPSGTDATSDKIEEVIVTARKRSEDVQKVPISVDVVSNQELADHQVTDFYGLQKLTPSLVVTSFQGESNDFAIRGVGTSVFGIQVEQSVGLVVDDVPIALPSLYLLEPYDLQRIEVLDGPQGMLFGKNASAGLINVVTENPALGEMDFMAHGEYANMTSAPDGGNRYRFDAAGNFAVSDDAALRVMGYWLHDDEVVQNLNPAQSGNFLGKEQGGVRAKFLWEPSSRLQILVSSDYTHQDGPGAGLLTYRSAPAGTLLASLNAAAGVTPGPDNTSMASASLNASTVDLYGASLKASYDVGGGYTLTDVTAFRKEDAAGVGDATMLPESIGLDNLIQTLQPSHQEQFSEELRFSSPTDQAFTWQAGLFYQSFGSHSFSEGRTDLGALIPGSLFNTVLATYCFLGAPYPCLLPPPPGLKSYSDSTTLTNLYSRSYAAFAEGQYKLTDDLNLTLGGRFTDDRKSYFYQLTDLPDSLLNFYPSQTHAADQRAQNFSWRGSLDYTVLPDVMAYFTYGRGYKGPGFDTGEYANPAQPLALVKPEISDNYEVGVKSTFLHDTLRLNGALFYETFTDFQTSANACLPNPAGGPCVTTIVNTNAGKLITDGVEGQFTYLPVEGLTLNGGVTYLNAYYEGLEAACYPNEPAGPGNGQCSNADWEAPGAVSNDNKNQLTQAPKWSTDLTARYNQPAIWNGWNGFIQGDITYRSSYNFQTNDDPGTRVSGYAIFGASLGALSDDGHIGVTVFGKNLTDQRVPTFIFITGASVLLGDPYNKIGHVQEFSPDSFRQIGISLDYHM